MHPALLKLSLNIRIQISLEISSILNKFVFYPINSGVLSVYAIFLWTYHWIFKKCISKKLIVWKIQLADIYQTVNFLGVAYKNTFPILLKSDLTIIILLSCLRGEEALWELSLHYLVAFLSQSIVQLLDLSSIRLYQRPTHCLPQMPADPSALSAKIPLTRIYIRSTFGQIAGV